VLLSPMIVSVWVLSWDALTMTRRTARRIFEAGF
jgi:hypothetical protein